ncbi:hypothetical protein FJ960_25470 [Mesorhizobium sp. B2-3-11]|uniref:NepR family anti-sigma factor n=1 Tax=Mesorhizobium sp. B2-3-11 TaxID=2589953 RepID=UPI0011263608|nr:NepR family anti-sigma factor [Mesorhizobium sp. B2-3-11]TPL96855.1 hypothetical protein FJ960_25470 [Mesorhizobium sp. B2-3-11]
MSYRDSANEQTTLAASVNGQISSKALKHYTAILPIFQVDETIPDRFKELLERLDQAEASLHEEPPRWHFDGLVLQSL